jgi:non-specific serine/threonine protein kinase
VRLGASLTYLAEVAKLALELCARGRVLPTLARRDGAFVARWKPVLTEAGDAERMGLLERAMPEACRAGLPDDAAGPPPEGWDSLRPPAPAAVLEDALAVLTDACARRSLGGTALPPPPRPRAARTTPAAAAWLAALMGPEGRVKGDDAELAALQGELDAWASAAAPAPAAAFRLCFRLSPPEEPDAESEEGEGGESDPGAWRLDFLLQASDDPSLLVPAERVWSARGRTLTLLQRRLADPQEWLLTELGRALRLFPALEPALRTARPEGLALDAAGAHHFLRDSAPLLEQDGFGVLVPPWWTKRSARLGAQLIARPQQAANASGLLGLEGICNYEWRLALGGEPLSPEEFRALARLKEPLVRLRGEWVELRPEDVQAALRLLERGGASGEAAALEVLRLAAGAEPAPGGLPVEAVRGEGWLASLLEGDARVEPLDTPPGLHGTLRPYQQRGLGWLAYLDGLGLGACLADDMGLGKTVQLLALLVRERAGDGAGARAPTLLVSPMSVVGNWQREAERFAPELRVHVHHGTDRLSGEDFERVAAGCDLVMTTYALAARDRSLLEAVAWGRVVLDEAQNIKNSAAKQSQAVRALRAPRRVALTGTPVENRLSELWSIMDFLNPGLLGSARDFRERFANPIERYRDDAPAARLRRLTGPFVLRRLKTDRGIIRDLPEKMEMKVFCNLTREQASLYQAVVDDMLRRVEESEGIERKGLILATMLKLKQLCDHPALLLQDRSALAGRSGKLQLLEDVLEEALSVRDRTLVFTQFAEMGRMLQDHLQGRFGREVLFLHGGTSRKARDAMVARFQAEGGPAVFLLSLKAGGTGLNLTAANQVIHFDRWWNPAVEDQATDRAFRIGQTRNVQVRKLVCAGTLEERIDAMIEQKKELAERIVGTGEGWLTELSTAELREVVRLSADSVTE